ncbi:MAG: T9SS type A sorting domain-containing protein, partial [Candidatus Cloacimonetes bacterium]|nr:T9SS type A sorting domain-containing protein [Candidatus Cloacimonadota bacterium]
QITIEDTDIPSTVGTELIYYDPTGGSIDPENTQTNQVKLDQNYPNPFQPWTTICFTLPKSQDVTLEVFNLLGQRVKMIFKGFLQAGSHPYNWNGLDDTGEQVNSGIYFYRLSGKNFQQTRKMVILR